MPTFVRVTLVSKNGTSCGGPNHRFQHVALSDPPQYKAISGEGDFAFGELTGVKDVNANIVDYQLKLIYANLGHACHGSYWNFYKVDGPVSTPPASPTGDYALGSSGSVDTDDGEAKVENDDV